MSVLLVAVVATVVVVWVVAALVVSVVVGRSIALAEERADHEHPVDDRMLTDHN